MLRNFHSYFEIKPGKFAYIQRDAFRLSADRWLFFAKKKWRPPSNYFHMRKGGHVAALRKHKDDEYFGHLDIQDFFSSVSKNKILKALKNIGFNFLDAQEFASESVVNIGGKLVLPYGFVQSSFLASLALAHSDLGKCIKTLQTSIAISVYMDDIIVSSNTSECVASAMDAIIHAGKNSLFFINNKKCSGPAHQVEAFNIGMSRHILRVTEPKFDEFRRRIFDLGECMSSKSTISYVLTVNDFQARQLQVIFENNKYPDNKRHSEC